MGAPVSRVAASLYKSSFFEVVNVSHHGVAVDTHRVGELLLGLSVIS
jgi:hypothetical protein